MPDKKKRPKVTEVTIKAVYPDGDSRTITIDPTSTEALFWSDHTVLEILAPFYEANEVYISKQEMIDRFGEKGEEIIGTEASIKVTEQLIEELWTKKEPGGGLPVMMGKTNDCLPI